MSDLKSWRETPFIGWIAFAAAVLLVLIYALYPLMTFTNVIASIGLVVLISFVVLWIAVLKS